jgi:hypothetical protein
LVNRAAAIACLLAVLLAGCATDVRKGDWVSKLPQDQWAQFRKTECLVELTWLDGDCEAPVGFSMTFLRDGRIRYQDIYGKIRWMRMDKADLAELKTLLGSPQFQQELSLLPSNFYAEEVVQIFGGAVSSARFIIVKELDSAPQAAKQIVAFMNRMGAKYFRRHYCPVDPARPAFDRYGRAAVVWFSPTGLA